MSEKINLEKLKIVASEIASKHQLNLMVLFGSQATGHTHKESDIDIGFLSDEDYGPMEIVRIQMELEQELGAGPVELVDLKKGSPLLLKCVAIQGILLYERASSVFANFRMYAIRRSIEARKLLDLQHASVIKFIHAHSQ